jgi:hypothetical protein
MKKMLYSLVLLFVIAPVTVVADITADDLPPGTVWYLHADLEAMRATDAGRKVYGWFQDEVILEVNEDLGIDLNEEVDRLTAFSNDGRGIIAIVEGALSKDLRDKVLAMVQAAGEFEALSYRGKDFYLVGQPDEEAMINVNGHETDSAYFTFDIPGKLVMATEEAQIKALIDSNGRVAGAGRHSDSLFVLSADKQFVQAGMRTTEFADEDDDWDSNILRNTEQAAVLVSDQGGMIAVVAQLVSSDAEMTQSLASIVGGLIALQAFSGEMDPDVAAVLRNTRVDAEGKVLSVSTVLDPDLIVRTLGD